MGAEMSKFSISVKVVRVMVVVAVLVILGVRAARRNAKDGATAEKGKVNIPWFAVGFLAVIGFNSLNLLPPIFVDAINYVDTFLLTMAMAALGAETSIDKFKKAGAKPFVLAFCLDVWLIVGGYILAKYLAPLCL